MFKRRKKSDHFNSTDYSLTNNHSFTFSCLRPSGDYILSFSISKWLIYLLLIFVFSFFLFIIYGVWFSYTRVTDYTELNTLRETVSKQNDVILDIDNRFNVLIKSVEGLVHSESQLRYKLKLKPVKKKKGRRVSRHQRKAERFRKDIESKFKGSKDQLEKYQLALNHIQDIIFDLNLNVMQLNKQVGIYESRFQSLPTIWPVYGSIRSDYGMRIHPKTGQRQFHKGIDIPSWIGAPIQATADGVVEFSGWGGGYGWLVILLHDYGGYRTVYAHMSERLVSKGMRVSKGQVIGRVGQSGLTTGPHIHYEIRRYTKAVAPKYYLDLDLFTASTRMW